MRGRDASLHYDIVILGTFAAWRLGTLQVRALPLARELARHGVRVAVVTVPWDIPSEAGVADVGGGVPIFNTRVGGTVATPFVVREQIQLVRSLSPRAIHLFKPRGYAGLASLRLRKTMPLIVDSDDWEGDGGWNRHGHYSLLQRRLFDWQERSLLARATAVTAASTLLHRRAKHLRSGLARERVWMIPNGLEVDWFEQLAAARARRQQAESDGRREIVLYSRMEEFPSDWVPRFAASLASRSIDRLTLRVIGDTKHGGCVGPVCIEHMGYVARKRIPDLLAHADIAIYPYADSLITRSKQSIKLLELMAAGCAVVASDVGDVASTLGNAGVVLSGSDPEHFAAVTARLLGDPELCRSASAHGPSRVESNFIIPVMGDRLMQAYQAWGIIS